MHWLQSAQGPHTQSWQKHETRERMCLSCPPKGTTTTTATVFTATSDEDDTKTVPNEATMAHNAHQAISDQDATSNVPGSREPITALLTHDGPKSIGAAPHMCPQGADATTRPRGLFIIMP